MIHQAACRANPCRICITPPHYNNTVPLALITAASLFCTLDMHTSGKPLRAALDTGAAERIGRLRDRLLDRGSTGHAAKDYIGLYSRCTRLLDLRNPTTDSCAQVNPIPSPASSTTSVSTADDDDAQDDTFKHIVAAAKVCMPQMQQVSDDVRRLARRIIRSEQAMALLQKDMSFHAAITGLKASDLARLVQDAASCALQAEGHSIQHQCPYVQGLAGFALTNILKR